MFQLKINQISNVLVTYTYIYIYIYIRHRAFRLAVRVYKAETGTGHVPRSVPGFLTLFIGTEGGVSNTKLRL